MSSEEQAEKCVVPNASDVDESSVVDEAEDQPDSAYMDICEEDIDVNVIVSKMVLLKILLIIIFALCISKRYKQV